MKKFKRFMKMGILIVGILIALTNCEKEDLVQTESATKLSQKKDLNIDKIKNSFSLKNYQDNFVKENLKVKWNKYDLYSDSNNFMIYEFDANLNSKISSLKGKNYFFSKYKVQVIIDTEGNLSFTVLKYFSNKKESLKKININSLNGFTGTISYFNNNGEILKIEGYSKGKYIEEFDMQSNKNISAREAPIANGTWVPMTIERWTDWYQNYLGGSLMFYSHSSNYTVTVEWVYIETGGSGYSGTYHSHSDEPHGHGSYPDPDIIDNHNDEILIDPSFENTKAECVFNKLQELSTDFKNSIKKFDGEFPVSHLKFKQSSNLPSNVNATTSPPSNYLITITINSNNLNRPNLSIARTIIHETIHAEMFRKILSIIDNGGDLNGLTRSQWTSKLSNGDYPGIFDYYSRYGVDGMQHQQMAAHYISTISDYLKQFQPGLSQEIYDSLAWTGLKGTTAWNSLTPSERTAITTTINSFDSQGGENCN